MLSKVPKDEAAYSPCIGQVDEFDSKRCTFLPVAGDALLEAQLAKIEHSFNQSREARLKDFLTQARRPPARPRRPPPAGSPRPPDRPTHRTPTSRTCSPGSGRTIST